MSRLSIFMTRSAIHADGGRVYSSIALLQTAAVQAIQFANSLNSNRTVILMASITIYTKPTCPYCIAAKALLKSKGAVFNEISIEGDRAAATTLSQRTGRHTVPQIYIGDYHVGGFDDLKALDDAGRLDALLRREAQAEY
jgi:glutaredoxin 3